MVNLQQTGLRRCICTRLHLVPNQETQMFLVSRLLTYHSSILVFPHSIETNCFATRQEERFKQIASVTMVISGNSRLLMLEVPITQWYVTPSLSE